MHSGSYHLNTLICLEKVPSSFKSQCYNMLNVTPYDGRPIVDKMNVLPNRDVATY